MPRSLTLMDKMKPRNLWRYQPASQACNYVYFGLNYLPQPLDPTTRAIKIFLRYYYLFIIKTLVNLVEFSVIFLPPTIKGKRKWKFESLNKKPIKLFFVNCVDVPNVYSTNRTHLYSSLVAQTIRNLGSNGSNLE